MQSVRLHPAMEGVELTLRIDDFDMRVIVPREVLETCLGAKTRDEWVQAASDCRDLLAQIVRRRLSRRSHDYGVVRSSDFVQRPDMPVVRGRRH